MTANQTPYGDLAVVELGYRAARYTNTVRILLLDMTLAQAFSAAESARLSLPQGVNPQGAVVPGYAAFLRRAKNAPTFLQAGARCVNSYFNFISILT